MSPDYRKTIATNGAIIAATLREHGVASMKITYIGGGDQGEVCDTALESSEPNTNAPDDINAEITYQAMEYKPDEHGNYQHLLVTRTADFNTATSDLWEIVEKTHIKGGWENNQGGGGTVTVLSNGVVSVDHYDYVIRSCDETKIDLTGAYEALSTLGNELAKMGATSVVMDYSGSVGNINNEQFTFTWVDGDTSRVAPEEFVDGLSEAFFAIINEKNGIEWSDGEGGEGLFTLSADGKASLESSSYYEDRDFAGEVIISATDYESETESPAP